MLPERKPRLVELPFDEKMLLDKCLWVDGYIKKLKGFPEDNEKFVKRMREIQEQWEGQLTDRGREILKELKGWTEDDELEFQMGDMHGEVRTTHHHPDVELYNG